MMQDVELYNAFEAAKVAIEAEDESIVRWVSSYGISTAKGISKRSVLVKALEISLQTSNIHGMLQSANAISLWVEAWGFGIIGVFPMNIQSQ